MGWLLRSAPTGCGAALPPRHMWRQMGVHSGAVSQRLMATQFCMAACLSWHCLQARPAGWRHVSEAGAGTRRQRQDRGGGRGAGDERAARRGMALFGLVCGYRGREQHSTSCCLGKRKLTRCTARCALRGIRWHGRSVSVSGSARLPLLPPCLSLVPGPDQNQRRQHEQNHATA